MPPNLPARPLPRYNIHHWGAGTTGVGGGPRGVPALLECRATAHTSARVLTMARPPPHPPSPPVIFFSGRWAEDAWAKLGLGACCRVVWACGRRAEGSIGWAEGGGRALRRGPHPLHLTLPSIRPPARALPPVGAGFQLGGPGWVAPPGFLWPGPSSWTCVPAARGVGFTNLYRGVAP